MGGGDGEKREQNGGGGGGREGDRETGMAQKGGETEKPE